MNLAPFSIVLGWMLPIAQVQPPTLPYFEESQPVVVQTAQPNEVAATTVRVPVSAAQLYYQRLAALQAGTLYTRVPRNSFQPAWEGVLENPTYEQWVALLAQEAKAIAAGQGENRLSVTIGDSLTLWLRPGLFDDDRLWLNQSIGGENTAKIRNRLTVLEETRPNSIFVMAGVNDLIGGRSDEAILTDYEEIIRQLRDHHPQARLVVQSILPTHHEAVSNDRIRTLNRELRAMSQEFGAMYLDLYPHFSDERGRLRSDLTTDGIHLSNGGYELWQLFIRQIDYQIMLDEKRSGSIE
ncbi:MAG: lysophospholipase [Cyanobacteria bacterium SID2]|nr:lysophospholipase [Cyanobacteria bacterium SID2]MBP0003512.1 lysophospholipase [Cyanobacteria bacterium SBC]